MDLRHALKEAKILILDKKTDQALKILDDSLDILQTKPPESLTQEDKLLLEAEIQESIGDTKIISQKDQEALTHLLMAITQLETYKSIIEKDYTEEISFRVYRKLSGAFERLGQQFESEKYMRKAGEIKGTILKKELFSRLSASGYKISENIRVIETEATPVDIIAEKGSVLKKTKIAIWFALDESEVDTIAYISKGYSKYTKNRYILLLMGQATMFNIHGAKIVNSIDSIQF